MALRLAGRLLLMGSAASATAVAGALGYDEGMRRSVYFWSHALPIYAHYRFNEWRIKAWSEEEQLKAWDLLHDRYSPVVERVTLDLRAFYVKLAQVCSTRDELVPPQYMKWCKKMQDNVPPEISAAQARSLVETSLGRPLAEVFSEWDDEPLGAASIGQVHKARLRESGREVVVKLQFPGIEHKFRSDMTTIKNFCKLLQPQHVPFLSEIERQFVTEFDYQGEAQNLELVRRNVMPVWGDQVCIPEPIVELCSRNVLVMEYLPGTKLVSALRAQYSRMAERMGKTLEQLEKEQRHNCESTKKGKGGVRAGVEESLTRAKWRMRLLSLALRVWDALRNAPRHLFNATVGMVTGSRLALIETEQLINLADIIDLLLRVHGHEIFIDGAFNGDPHPGNILLMPDGRLGLIDYGQVKIMSLPSRLLLARLTVALADDDRPAVVRLITQMGIRTRHNNPDILYRFAAFWNDRDTDDITHGMNIQLFMEWLDRTDPIVEAADDYVMAGRVSVLLRGLALAFGIRLSVAPIWREHAQRLIDQHPE